MAQVKGLILVRISRKTSLACCKALHRSRPGHPVVASGRTGRSGLVHGRLQVGPGQIILLHLEVDHGHIDGEP